MDIAARNESILMENPKTFIARIKGALKKSKIIMSCNFETVCCTDLQRSTEGTIFGRSRSRSRSHKTFGFWPKAEAEAEGTNNDKIHRNQLQN